jgi:hypothetical protein
MDEVSSSIVRGKGMKISEGGKEQNQGRDGSNEMEGNYGNGKGEEWRGWNGRSRRQQDRRKDEEGFQRKDDEKERSRRLTENTKQKNDSRLPVRDYESERIRFFTLKH